MNEDSLCLIIGNRYGKSYFNRYMRTKTNKEKNIERKEKNRIKCY